MRLSFYFFIKYPTIIEPTNKTTNNKKPRTYSLGCVDTSVVCSSCLTSLLK